MIATRTAVAATFAVCVLSTTNGSTPAPVDVATLMGSTVHVSAAGENIQQIWAYADPDDGQHLITCGYFSNSQKNASYGYVYASPDAGTTWRRVLLDDSTRWVTEESCIYGDNGHAYFADGQVDTSTGQPRHEWGHLQLYTSSDHGMNWQRAGRRAEGFVDWTFLAAVPQDQHHASSLVIFGNCATDHVGHLAKERPVALEADGSARLTAELIPLSPHNLYGTFSGGSTVLPDRTALFIADTQAASRMDMKAMPPQVHTRLDVFSVSPSHQLRSRALLRTGYGRYFGFDPGPALVRAPDHGRFPGRLYAAWEESDWSMLRGDSLSELWLGVSDDEGYHWSSRRIFPPDDALPAACAHELTVVNGIRLAVNNQGTLGILWSVSGKQLQFASSADGGSTFRPGQLVAKQLSGAPSVTDAVPWNEWGLAQFLASQAGKSQDSFVDQSHLGLSVRMERPQGITEIGLTADARNTFHAFWASVDNEGNHELLTRIIEVSSNVPATSVRLTSGEDLPCASEPEPLNPDMPRSPPVLTFEGQREVTSLLDLQVDQLNYAAESHAVTVQVILMNKSASLVRGPLTLFAVGLHSDFGRPIVLNATGTQQGQPFWDLSEAIPAEGLRPMAHSRPVELRFKLEQFDAARPSSDALASWVRVYSSR
jgi:hypothetical protein